MKRILFSAFFISLIFFSCQDPKNPVSPEEPSNDQSLGKTTFIYADHYIVEYTVADLESVVQEVGGKVDRLFPELGLAQVSGLDDKSAKALKKKSGIKEVTQDILVNWVEPETEFTAEHIGEDETFWPIQWNMTAISAPQAWEAGYTGTGVRVAVIDGGMSKDHQDLDDNIDATASKSFVDGLEWYEDADDFRHASHVAGIIAAEDNSVGTIGVAPNATIIALKALEEGSGSFGDILAAIYYAATDADADIINMSLGAFFPRNSLDAAKLNNALGQAITFATQQGVLVVTSAGNDGIDFDHAYMYVHMPSEAQNTVNVSATGPVDFYNGGTNFDRPASYTNYGQSVIDFAAPGGDYTLFPNGNWYLDMVISPASGFSGYGWAAGTSMATPHVVGVAALIIEKHGGNLSPSQVKAILKKSSDDLGKPGNDDFYGQGRVNAYNAVMY